MSTATYDHLLEKLNDSLSRKTPISGNHISWRTITCNCEVKVKQSHNTPMEEQGERRYSSYSFTTSVLDRGELLSVMPRPCFLPPRKEPLVPIVHRRLGWPQSRYGHRRYRKNPLPLPGIKPESPGCPASRSQTLYWLNYPGS
jgi:hypothetical protein